MRELAAACLTQIARFASGYDAEPEAQEGHSPAINRAHTVEVPLDIEQLNHYFIKQRWTDGLPIIPPTMERVKRMLSQTSCGAKDVVAIIPPAFGAASVESIAVNAVMAGCDPRFFSVVIAAVKAATAPEFNLQGVQATTNPATPWLIVNGPIARRIGINAEINCLGQGHWANATIGRALRLIMQNIGGALPGEMDRATQGQPGKYSFCCSENEFANPWESLHVERGFAAEDSTVSIVCAAGTLNMNSHSKVAADLIKAFADTLAHATSNDYWTGGEPWIVLSPEHAQVLHGAGMSKQDVKREIWEKSKMRAGRMADRDFVRTQDARRTELGEITPDSMLPISEKPDLIGIVVAGGPGTHSVYVPTYGNTRSATRKVEQ